MNTKFEAFSNDKLFEILANQNDYVEEAVQAALTILKERNISPEDLSFYTKNKLNELEDKKVLENEPLNLIGKIMCVTFPFIGFVGWAIIQITYHEKGYERKKQDVTKFMIIGFVLWVIIVNLIIV